MVGIVTSSVPVMPPGWWTPLQTNTVIFGQARVTVRLSGRAATAVRTSMSARQVEHLLPNLMLAYTISYPLKPRNIISSFGVTEVQLHKAPSKQYFESFLII